MSCLYSLRPYTSLVCYCLLLCRLSSLISLLLFLHFFFFFNDTPTTEIYTLSLHDALPISLLGAHHAVALPTVLRSGARASSAIRSEEHTSELQSPDHLVCRLLLEKKKKKKKKNNNNKNKTAH